MRVFPILAFALSCAIASPALAATNILPAATTSVTVTGTDGVLRNAYWSIGSTPSSVGAAYDGITPAEGTQWNNTSFWWDQDSRVNAGPVTLTFLLDGMYTISSLIAQADNNDHYRVEYWDGGHWATAWNIGSVTGWGLRTRSSGALSAFTTNRLRFSATGGDNYYALSELQVFGNAGAVPEPGIWMLMLLGFGALGAALRRRHRLPATQAC